MNHKMKRIFASLLMLTVCALTLQGVFATASVDNGASNSHSHTHVSNSNFVTNSRTSTTASGTTSTGSETVSIDHTNTFTTNGDCRIHSNVIQIFIDSVLTFFHNNTETHCG